MLSPAAPNEMTTPPPARRVRPPAVPGSAVAGTPASEGDFFYADSDADDEPEVVAATPVEAPRAGEVFRTTSRTENEALPTLC